ncbi:transposase [Streptomyces sp. H27-G5]|uniref:transposase n=1 Tax=Streptomyces sp. H27-G5 TaxID=2996698 RepID=UPI00226DE1D5|nr:transposase [Streptomyces sp. H27-G5]MCY0919454.1 transposase [Streptomyces sp. H27-G5]
MTRSRSYSPEFREEAVQMALKSSKPIAEVARNLEVNSETLRSWVRRYERDHGRQAGPLAVDERARLKELERRIREVEMENAFLKKAAAYVCPERKVAAGVGR